MAKAKAKGTSSPAVRRKPAETPEARELQMIAYAEALAEQQLRDGTASSQVITHYLKEGSMKARLEREKLAEENKLLRAKIELAEAEAKNNDKYEEVLIALRKYNGQGDDDEY